MNDVGAVNLFLGAGKVFVHPRNPDSVAGASKRTTGRGVFGRGMPPQVRRPRAWQSHKCQNQAPGETEGLRMAGWATCVAHDKLSFPWKK